MQTKLVTVHYAVWFKARLSENRRDAMTRGLRQAAMAWQRSMSPMNPLPPSMGWIQYFG